jgi:hypothetical protein
VVHVLQTASICAPSFCHFYAASLFLYHCTRSNAFLSGNNHSIYAQPTQKAMYAAEPSNQPRAGAIPDLGLLKRIQDEIQAKTKLSSDSFKAYLVPDDAKEIIHRGRIPRLLGLQRDSQTAKLVLEHQTSILCALIHSGATECLKEYIQYFFISPIKTRYTDKDLPFREGTSDYEYLTEFFNWNPPHSNVRSMFVERQYRFCPWIIDVARDVEVVDIPDEYRLPFESDTQNLGVGFFGNVALVHISRGCMNMKEPEGLNRDVGHS